MIYRQGGKLKLVSEPSGKPSGQPNRRASRKDGGASLVPIASPLSTKTLSLARGRLPASMLAIAHCANFPSAAAPAAGDTDGDDNDDVHFALRKTYASVPPPNASLPSRAGVRDELGPCATVS